MISLENLKPFFLGLNISSSDDDDNAAAGLAAHHVLPPFALFTHRVASQRAYSLFISTV